MVNGIEEPFSSESAEQPGDRQCLVMGFGSCWGMDQAGWLIADRINALTGGCLAIFKAQVPHVLLDYLPHAGHLHLIDAEIRPEPQLRRYAIDASSGAIALHAVYGLQTANWEPVTKPESYEDVALCSSSSHQYGLTQVLKLAANLQLLPQSTKLWTVGIADPRESSTEDYRLESLLDQCANSLASELSNA